MAEWTEHYFQCEVNNEFIIEPKCTCPEGWPVKHSPALDHVDPWADVKEFITTFRMLPGEDRDDVEDALKTLIKAREEKVRTETTAFYNRRYRQKGKW